MSDPAPSNSSGWTVNTYAAHNEALRAAEEKFEQERDRRYSEVNLEKEKALKIKETADLAALQLAREIQQYKDEKANQLREQINSERGLYATKGDLLAAMEKVEATVKPLSVFVQSQRGRREGVTVGTGFIVAALGTFATLITVIIVVARVFGGG